MSRVVCARSDPRRLGTELSYSLEATLPVVAHQPTSDRTLGLSHERLDAAPQTLRLPAADIHRLRIYGPSSMQARRTLARASAPGTLGQCSLPFAPAKNAWTIESNETRVPIKR